MTFAKPIPLTFLEQFFSFLPDAPTPDQKVLAERLERFIAMPQARAAFILRGYAGTGKTTAVAALVKTLPALGLKSVLLAPTGRAAKVMSKFSGKTALTIHKKIYHSQGAAGGGMKFTLAHNRHKHTLFIVDEASMISGRDKQIVRGARNLLEDLITYVYDGKGCRLLFIGDTAQLPPVGSDISPALDPKPLKNSYQLSLKGAELKAVLRQAQESGILINATQLRQQVNQEYPHIRFQLSGYADIQPLQGNDLEEVLHDCYRQYGEEETIILCRSNKRANLFNQQIRVRIKDQENEISSGDYIMVVKNNYFWTEGQTEIGFIANGDIAEIERLGSVEARYGFSFTDAAIRLVDYPNQPSLEVKLILDAINVESASLTSTQQQALFNALTEEYSNISSRSKRLQAIKKDPYFNALQLKFAYAITCHKAQGGQWKAVIVDQGYLTEEMIDREYARWLYTAVSRATEKLYLLNFHPRFFNEVQS